MSDKKKKKGPGGGGGGDHDGGGGHGAPLWVVSFCDMTILEMSFFVILLAGSSQKSAADDELLAILASIKAGFGYVPNFKSTEKMDMAVLQILAHNKNRATNKNQIEWYSNRQADLNPPHDPSLWSRVKGTVGKPIIFDENSAELPLNWETRVDEIAERLRHHFRQILIQSHCSPAEAAADPQQGHDLTFRRAVAIKEAFEKRGIAASKLRIVSCAAFDTQRESNTEMQRRTVIALGTYYLPGGDQLMEDLTAPPGQEPSSSRRGK